MKNMLKLHKYDFSLSEAYKKNSIKQAMVEYYDEYGSIPTIFVLSSGSCEIEQYFKSFNDVDESTQFIYSKNIPMMSYYLLEVKDLEKFKNIEDPKVRTISKKVSCMSGGDKLFIPKTVEIPIEVLQTYLDQFKE